MSRSKFWQGVLLGAIAGGAVSMLDKETRQSVLSSCKKNSEALSFYVKHPLEAIDCVKQSTSKAKATIEEMADEFAFLTRKIEELREITPQVAEMVTDTKEAFTEQDDLKQ